MIVRRSLLFIAVALFALAAEAENELRFGVTGSESGSYSAAMSQPAVQKLLVGMASEGRTAEFIDKALESSRAHRADLEQLGLIRRDGVVYVLSFVLLTTKDMETIARVAGERAKSLAGKIVARRAEVEQALAPYDVGAIDRKAVAYIILGCFSFDWDGLDITADDGYRTTAQKRPNGEQYAPWAQQPVESVEKTLFKGSHNRYLPRVVFTSFGDHFSVPRAALPDLFMRVPSRATEAETPMPIRRAVGKRVQSALDAELSRIGAVVMALRDGPRSAADLAQLAGLPGQEASDDLAFLQTLGYVTQSGEKFAAAIPILTARDAALVSTLRRIGRESLRAWLAENYDALRAELKDITPLRFGVPYAAVFTEIWHFVFGSANRELVRAGLFADPYGGGTFRGFIPVVWDPDLMKDGERK